MTEAVCKYFKKTPGIRFPSSDCKGLFLQTQHFIIYYLNSHFSLLKISNRFLLEKNKDHKVWRLEDKEYHPYVTYNTVVDGIDKQFDG